jgi:hypothetical protein
MCYSALVYAGLKKLGLLMKARIDYALFAELFRERAENISIRIQTALDFDFLATEEPSDKAIQHSIVQYRQKKAAEIEQALFKFKGRLLEAEKKLESKFTKGAEKGKGIAQRGIENSKLQLKQMNLLSVNDDSLRIFSQYWAPVIVFRESERVIVPMRYQLRPQGVPESFDRKYPGCYNARLDSLVPCIWDQWPTRDNPTLTSFALITDDPPQEIAETGHNRCPIFLKEKNIDSWLKPEGLSSEELFRILKDRERPFYKHAIAA